MRWDPDGRNPRPGEGAGASGTELSGSKQHPEYITHLDPAQLIPRPVRADEIPELRALWWRQRALGHRLPAEAGIIAIKGGAK